VWPKRKRNKHTFPVYTVSMPVAIIWANHFIAKFSFISEPTDALSIFGALSVIVAVVTTFYF
jgi:hypothetical protein